jgi:putative ABC transport system substrate-binding protein
LRERGYVEGQNLGIEFRSAEGREDQVPDLAAELVRLPVDLIVAVGDVPTRAASQASGAIPIVMAGGRDPVGSGLVASLAHPGGNITGLTFFDAQLGEKRLELLKTAMPAVSRVSILGHPTRSLPEYRAAEAAASALGVRLKLLGVQSAEDLESAFELATRERAEAVIVAGTNVTIARLPWIAERALASQLPAVSERREFVQAGGLMAYGPNFLDMLRRAAYYVDRILRGAKPADLPVEQPREFDFVVNLKTAQALGLTFPNEIMLQVTEVVQ